MADEARDQSPQETPDDPSRREFVAMSIAAGIVAAAGSASAADLPVVEKNVEIKMPDGTCDAVFIHPASGSHPGVLIWPDAFGPRCATSASGSPRKAIRCWCRTRSTASPRRR